MEPVRTQDNLKRRKVSCAVDVRFCTPVFSNRLSLFQAAFLCLVSVVLKVFRGTRAFGSKKMKFSLAKFKRPVCRCRAIGELKEAPLGRPELPTNAFAEVERSWISDRSTNFLGSQIEDSFNFSFHSAYSFYLTEYDWHFKASRKHKWPYQIMRWSLKYFWHLKYATR